MAPGLQLLYSSVCRDITVPQDALVCFVHWELVARGYGCIGAGDRERSAPFRNMCQRIRQNSYSNLHGNLRFTFNELLKRMTLHINDESLPEHPGPNETKSELLPAGWNADKELYTLRYRSVDDTSEILLKAIMVENSMIINAMDPKLEQVVDLTLNVAEYIDGDHLNNFQRVYKKSEELSRQLLATIISPFTRQKNTPKEEQKEPRGIDPLLIPPRSLQPPSRPPIWNDPLAPFAVGGADLDPFGGRSGGMIVDPLRSGFPRSGFDPSRGLPGRLPRGSVPPGARFDPFGPPGSNHPGPDPDHLPPPGYDDMFM